MFKNIVLPVLTLAFMIIVGLIIFSSGDFPLKMIWFVVSFFLTAMGVYWKFKRKENNKTENWQSKDSGQFPQDDSSPHL